MRHSILFIFILLCPVLARTQRIYAANSVLAGGNWYKIAVKDAGVCRVTASFLNSLGINTSNLSSASIRLYGNGGAMLPESNSAPRPDDLVENAIQVSDGGDGIFNGSDFFLFYAQGPHTWEKDSLNKSFTHRFNLYSDEVYYFITIGGSGKRIAQQTAAPAANVNISSFNDRYFLELDSLNFLASGKEWFGQEFANLPGRSLNRQFTLNIPGLLTGTAARFSASFAARSQGGASRFDVFINGTPVQQHPISPVGAGIYDLFARLSVKAVSFTPTQSNLTIQANFNPGSPNAQGWLNWWELNARRNLSMAGTDQLLFRDWNSVAPGNTGRFTIQNAAATAQVWDLGNPLEPVKMLTSAGGSDLFFNNDCSLLREYLCFSGNSFITPVAVGRVENQNLHNAQALPFLIITHPRFLTQANLLAAHHLQRDGLRAAVATTEQIYNEFSSGRPDPTALRDWVKMYYDRAGTDTAKRPKILLLLGDASFDYKNRVANNTSLVPAYESESSLDPLSTYTSDDFFALLDDGDDINNNSAPNLLDIGIGRIPAREQAEAQHYVNKVLAYTSAKALGPWRNQFSFIADDEDLNLHLQDAETITATAAATAPVFDLTKIYLDAYRQESGSGGSRYPAVNEAVNSRIFNGNLIWNYNGHGGFKRLAEEVVLDQEIVNSWNNPDKLPLFITATCDFAPYDNPAIRSIGEDLLLREKTGGIALMTTTRVVFAFSNRIMNDNYLRIGLKRNAGGFYPNLGKAVLEAKNFTYLSSGDIINNRKFTLLGDPALQLGFPQHQVNTTSINGRPPGATPDTLQALNKYTITGEVTSQAGSLLSGFNGTVYPVIYDKVQTITTLANDPGSTPVGFATQNNIIYRGKAKVVNGKFTYSFIVPRDINYQLGAGKITYYAENGREDGNGYFNQILVGGAGSGAGNDSEGPQIRAWLNDEKFVNGSITNPAPVLLLRLFDSSGINTVGAGIGHDLVATLDDDNRRFFILNDFYEADVDDFRSGRVAFQLPELEEGVHTLRIKAWDVANNSGEYVLEFRVVKKEKLELQHVLNYPNPFTTHTTFFFEHNHPGEDLEASIRIFTVGGRIVKTINKTINTAGNRSCEIEWDGTDDFGARLGRGVYIYRLRIRDITGKSIEKLEKLMLL